MMSESFFADYFSSKELDSAIPSQDNPSHRPFQEFKTQPESNIDPKEYSNAQENYPTTPEIARPRRPKTKTKRAKRGDSLERQIAKLILNESSMVHGINVEFNATQTLSPAEILLDLKDFNTSHNQFSRTASQSIATLTNEIDEFKKSDDSYIDDSTDLGHFAEDCNEILRPRELFPKSSSDSDAFDFDANNNEWAVFDNCSIFGTEHQPPNEPYNDDIPEETRNEVKAESVDFDEKVSQEPASIEAPSETETEKEHDEAHDEAEEEKVGEEMIEVHNPESPSIISSGDKSAQSESRTSLLDAPSNLKGRSYDFVSKQSPSSVTHFHAKEGFASVKDFPAKEGFVTHRTVGSYTLKRQSPTVSKLHWNPKPPEHSNFMLYRTGDTLN